jgi:membrane-bound ClpP family serine protease
MNMLEVYWGCFILGASFALVTVIFGDFLNGAVDGILNFLSLDGFEFLNPMTWFGGITIFGGMGILFSEYTSLSIWMIAFLSGVIAIILAACMYFFYVKPLNQSENSTSFSIEEHVGRIGEVITTIPPKGFGEILIKVGAGNTNEIAGSYEGDEIPYVAKVVVVEVKDRTLFVTRFD